MNRSTQSSLYRKLPSVDEICRLDSLISSAERGGREALVAAAREVLSQLRQEVAEGNLSEAELDILLAAIPAAVKQQLQINLSNSLRPVINATGVILHTNLGRAPLAAAALEHLGEIASSYSNLEFDLAKGERGKRDIHVDHMFRQLLVEAAYEVSTIVVNNNAAAVLLALNTLAEDGEVIVSRGELVEIGGSFRVPDVMQKSRAVLREVGTTNRTRISDYETAITEKTRLLLRVHRSNFEITGFTEEPQLAELVALSRRRNIPLMQDLGSGALMDLRSVGIQNEPGVLDSLRAGVDVVAYSGDKLLGGPQAGMLSGRGEIIARMRTNSLFRALRVDKLTYAALEATLRLYLVCDLDAIPAIRMMRLSKVEIERRCHAFVEHFDSRHFSRDIIDGESLLGGGAAPSSTLPTALIAIESSRLSAHDIETGLRAAEPPVMVRVAEGRVLIDLRTVRPEEERFIVDALNKLAGESPAAAGIR